MNDVTTKQIQALIAAGIDLNEFFGNTVETTTTKTTTSKKSKKQPKTLVAAKKHCYEARQARRSDSSRKGGAGMTKQEKSDLYAALTAELGQRPTTAQWNRACKKARGV